MIISLIQCSAIEWVEQGVVKVIVNLEDDQQQKSELSKPAQAILSKYVQKEMFGTFITAKWVKNFAFRSK